MGLLRQQPQLGLRIGIFRRVVRCEGAFICGLCRGQYQHEPEALSCLRRCWSEVLQSEGVLTYRERAGLRYKCRFCARRHEQRQAAQECAEACKSRFQQRQEFEFALLVHEAEGDLPPPPVRRSARKVQPSLRLLPSAVKKTKKPRPQPVLVAAPTPAPQLGAEAGVVSADVAASDAPMEAVPKVKTVRDISRDKDVFYREGAKYMCKVCSKDYFTKLEVQQCYMSHD